MVFKWLFYLGSIGPTTQSKNKWHSGNHSAQWHQKWPHNRRPAVELSFHGETVSRKKWWLKLNSVRCLLPVRSCKYMQHESHLEHVNCKYHIVYRLSMVFTIFTREVWLPKAGFDDCKSPGFNETSDTSLLRLLGRLTGKWWHLTTPFLP